MKNFRLMTEMFMMDNGCLNASWCDKIVDLFGTEELGLRAGLASQTITIKGGDLPYMNDLYLLVHGESEEIRFLNGRYPELCEVLDKMWDLLDSDYFDNVDEESNK